MEQLEFEMPDGPFKNLDLGGRLQKVVQACHNDAFDSIHLRLLVSHAVVGNILTEDCRGLLCELLGYARQPAFDIDPKSAIQQIFDSHRKTAFGEILEKQVYSRLADQMMPEAAIPQALEAAVEVQINTSRTRIEDECLRALASEEMRRDEFDRIEVRKKEAFDALAKDDICSAVLKLDKNAFRTAVVKRTDLEEGPRL